MRERRYLFFSGAGTALVVVAMVQANMALLVFGVALLVLGAFREARLDSVATNPKEEP